MSAPRRAVAWIREHPAVADLALAVILWAAVLPGLWLYQDQTVDGTRYHQVDVVGVLLLSAATLPVALRRRSPEPVLVVTGICTTLLQSRDYADTGVAIGAFVALYTVAVYVPRPRVWWSLGFALALVAVSESIQHQHFDLYVTNWLMALATFVLGDNVRTRRAYVVSLEERADRAERAQEERAARAVTEERTRIAREMHDVVAHHVTVMAVQASAARRTRDPEAADRALAQIESTGREALVEMRRLLEVLRTEDGDTARTDKLRPQPSLADLPDMAARAADAGLPVAVEVTGPVRDLPPGLDLTAYRIVQEALTNAHRHAGPASAKVALRYGPADLAIEVTDDGRGAASAAAGSAESGGHGLVGMRERVAVFGGTLRTGPRRGGGWEVLARLPLDDTTSAAAPATDPASAATADAATAPAGAVAPESSGSAAPAAPVAPVTPAATAGAAGPDVSPEDGERPTADAPAGRSRDGGGDRSGSRSGGRPAARSGAGAGRGAR